MTDYLRHVDTHGMELAAHTLEYEFDLIAERMRAEEPDEAKTALLERVDAYRDITRQTVKLIEALDELGEE